MTDKKENIQRILGNHGKITQNGDIIEFNNAKFENLNSTLIQNLENLRIELQYEEGILKNEKEILTKLLSLNNHNFDFLINGLYSFSPEKINDFSLELKIEYINKSKLSKSWNIKDIREFIQRIYKEESFFYIDMENYEKKCDKFTFLLTNFLLKEKIINNEMPNLDDIKLAIKFYKESPDFDFIEIFGYKFNNRYRLSELISIFKVNFDNLLLEGFIEDIRNHNIDVLSMFFFEFENHKEWTLENLYIWLQKSNIKSNLAKTEAKTIDDLINLGLNGYFKDEDIKLWQILKKRYKSPNAIILKSFFNNHKCSDWTINELYDWLEENNPDSDLRKISVNSIGEIFDLALGDGYFMNEDATLWNDLQNLYR